MSNVVKMTRRVVVYLARNYLIKIVITYFSSVSEWAPKDLFCNKFRVHMRCGCLLKRANKLDLWLTDFIAADLFVVERVDEPIFRVDNLYRSFDAAMIYRENNAAADNVNEINVQDVWGEKKNVRKVLSVIEWDFTYIYERCRILQWWRQSSWD